MSSEYGSPFQAMSPLILPLPRRSVSGKPKRSSSLPASSMSSVKFRLVLLLPSLVSHLPVPFSVPSGLASGQPVDAPLAPGQRLRVAGQQFQPAQLLVEQFEAFGHDVQRRDGGGRAAVGLRAGLLTSSAADSGITSEASRAVTLPRPWPVGDSSQVTWPDTWRESMLACQVSSWCEAPTTTSASLRSPMISSLARAAITSGTM